jgi:putative transposase
VPLQLSPPPGFGDTSVVVLRELVAARVREHETQARAAADAQGRRFLGSRHVGKQSVFDRPATHEPRFGLNPRVAGHDKWKRIELLQELRAFRAAYREAWLQFCAGLRAVVFPAGTWLLRQRFGVTCAAPS